MSGAAHRTVHPILTSLAPNLLHNLGMHIDDAVQAILDLRRDYIAPVAQAQRMDLVANAVLMTPPLVLLLGNHSSGKSSFINHLLGRKIQRTGVAPTDDGFTTLVYGEQERSFDGQALVSNPDLPFGELGHFGPDLTKHLQGRALDADLLQYVRLIDSPGMIDSSDAASKRPYDFPAVVRWFAEKADLVLLFFDPEKPGTTGETLRVLTESLVGIDHKMRIVMNKMDLFDGVRDFARTYGALCWNLSRSLATKDMPHIYTTVLPEQVRDRAGLPLDGFAAALLELEQYIADLPQRRLDSALSRVVDEGRQLLLRATVTEHLRQLVTKSKRQTFAICLLCLLAAAGVGYWFYQLEVINWTAVGISGGIAVMFGLLTYWLPGRMAQKRERRGYHELDQFFQQCFQLELNRREAADDWLHDWSHARAGLSKMLPAIGLNAMGKVRPGKIKKLRNVLENDLTKFRTMQ